MERPTVNPRKSEHGLRRIGDRRILMFQLSGFYLTVLKRICLGVVEIYDSGGKGVGL